MLAQTKLNSVFISRALTDSDISRDEFILVNNVLKNYDDIKEEIKNLKTEKVHRGVQFIYQIILPYWLKCIKNTESKNPRTKMTRNERIILLWQ